MTIIDEGKRIRGDIAKLRPDKRRRYPSESKARILAWTRRATALGMLEAECGRVLGIKAWRISTWQRQDPMPRAEADEPVALVPIDVSPLTIHDGPTVVTPSGYRVEGLSLEQIATLLRELP